MEAGMAGDTGLLDGVCTEEWDFPISGAQGGQPLVEDEW